MRETPPAEQRLPKPVVDQVRPRAQQSVHRTDFEPAAVQPLDVPNMRVRNMRGEFMRSVNNHSNGQVGQHHVPAAPSHYPFTGDVPRNGRDYSRHPTYPSHREIVKLDKWGIKFDGKPETLTGLM